MSTTKKLQRRESDPMERAAVSGDGFIILRFVSWLNKFARLLHVRATDDNPYHELCEFREDERRRVEAIYILDSEGNRAGALKVVNPHHVRNYERSES